MAFSFYFHDYETFGPDPRRDRPAQFAGIRTDADFNPIGEPTVLFCRPSPDYLPDPEACLITGITPQLCAEKGVCEAEFAAVIQAQMARPETCSLGYNTLRFDDEVTRHLLYRNLYDPYEREWRNGNSRWDLIDLVRLTFALRPEGIEWPVHPDGRPSFKLEQITAANGLVHEHAHDALSDVFATIALAKLLKERKPRLFDFAWKHRDKRSATALLALGSWQPLLHVSEKYPATKGCLAVVVAVAPTPGNNNGVLVYDLSADPAPLLESGPEALRRLLFTPAAQLAEGESRIPIKTVHLNRSPVLAPLNVVGPKDAARWQLDLEACAKHLQRLQSAPELAEKLKQAFVRPETEPEDPETALYQGFIGDLDKNILARLRGLSPRQLAGVHPDFDDQRLPELFFRYRARNWPETLTPEEAADWDSFCFERLAVARPRYEEKLSRLRGSATDERDGKLLAALADYLPARVAVS